MIKSILKRFLLPLFYCLLAQLAFASAPNWSVNAASFTYGMSIVAQVNFNDVPNNALGNKIGIFVGTQLRGTASPTIIGGKAYYFISVYSNMASGDSLVFRVYTQSDDLIHAAHPPAVFQSYGALGNVEGAYLLSIYSNDDFPITLDALPNQLGPAGTGLPPIKLSPYLHSIDNNPIVWTAPSTSHLNTAIIGGYLFVTPSAPLWEGLDTITVTATESGTSAAHSAVRKFLVRIMPGFVGPDFADITPQCITPGGSFQGFDLDNFLTYGGACRSYSYKTYPFTSNMPNPQWQQPNGGGSVVMNLIAAVKFGPNDLYSPGSQLAVYRGNTLVGLGNPVLYSGGVLYFIPLQSMGTGAFTFQFYDAERQFLYSVPSDLVFVPGGSAGTVANPYSIQLSPLSINVGMNGMVSATINDPNWSGSFPVQFSVVDCVFPAVKRDSATTFFNIGVMPTYYADADGDGFGNINAQVKACMKPTGYTLDATDCNDALASVHVGAVEQCSNNIDDDCDGTLDERFFDLTPSYIKHVACFGGNDGVVRVNAAAFADVANVFDFHFKWNNGDTLRSALGLVAGIYTVTVTHSPSGCTAIATETVNNATPIVITETNSLHKNLKCNGVSIGQASVNATGGAGALSYKWSNMATTKKISNLAAGTYTVTVTDSRLCTKTLQTIITEPALLDIPYIESVAMTGTNAGKYKVTVTATGGTGAKLYSKNHTVWQTSKVFPQLTTGNYTFYVKDANLCEDMFASPVPSCPLLNFYADADGDGYGNPNALQKSCIAPPGYILNHTDCNDSPSNGGANIYPGALEMCGNNTDDDCDGTLDEAFFTLTAPNRTNITCFGGQDGAARTNPVPAVGTNVSGITYLWSNGGTTRTINTLTAGTYSVTVTHAASGCTQMEPITLTQPTAIIVTENPTMHRNVVCYGTNIGRAVALATGGAGAKTYLWSNGTTGMLLNGVAAGTYTVTATDTRGCVGTLPILIGGPTVALDITVVSAIPMTGTNAGKFKVTVAGTGGSGPLKYRRKPANSTTWTTNPVFPQLLPGTYKFFVRDTNLCTDSVTTTLTLISNIDDRSNMLELETPKNQLTLSPNPAKDVLIVEMNEGEAFDGTVVITDALGREIRNDAVKLDTNEPYLIHLGKFQNGAYNLSYWGNDGHRMDKRFVVQQ